MATMSASALAPSIGLPTRSKSWQSKRYGDFMHGRLPELADVKRWDGAARRGYEWNSLRRVSDLCLRSNKSRGACQS